jgi:hypothetical protein
MTLISHQADAPATEYQHRASPASGVELTILMPCLNEAETIETCIGKAKAFLERARVTGEILIADNGSSDGSQELATSLGARVITVRQRGYGAALQAGIQAAIGNFIIMADADDSYDFSNLDDFLSSLRGGAELVMGNRFAGGIKPGAMPFLHKFLGNPVLSFLGRTFFGIPVRDFHCGLRGFRTEAIRALGLRTSGMEFASEMVVRSAIAGLRIQEVPTTLSPDGRSRPPHLKTWRDGWRHLKFLLMYSPRWLFIIPGCTLAALGVIGAALLLVGPFAVAQNVILDLNSFLACCFLIMIGTQLLFYGILSRDFASRAGFLPARTRASAVAQRFTTDGMIWLALLLMAAGLGLFTYAVSEWASVSFGPLISTTIPRMVAGGLTLLVIGTQTFFSAFLLGILRIERLATRTND